MNRLRNRNKANSAPKKQEKTTNEKTTKENIGHLVGKSRANAMQVLQGKTVQYIALKSGEAIPAAPQSTYVICYDSITDIVISAA